MVSFLNTILGRAAAERARGATSPTLPLATRSPEADAAARHPQFPALGTSDGARRNGSLDIGTWDGAR